MGESAYRRRFFHLLVVMPMRTKYETEKTERGMSRRMVCRLAGLILSAITPVVPHCDTY